MFYIVIPVRLATYLITWPAHPSWISMLDGAQTLLGALLLWARWA